MNGHIIATCRSPRHGFSKSLEPAITFVPGLGVEGDAHAGATVKHRSRVKRDPSQPNLRQVHLIHAELLDEVRGKGFEVAPGAMGENITTRGLDLLALPRGCRLLIGRAAVVEVTGLRNPCHQIDGPERSAGRRDQPRSRTRSPIRAESLRVGTQVPAPF